MQAKEEEDQKRLVQQDQVLVLLQHQLNHNQAERDEEVDQEASAIDVAGATRRGIEIYVAANVSSATKKRRGIGVAANVSSATGRGRGIGVTANVSSATRRGIVVVVAAVDATRRGRRIGVIVTVVVGAIRRERGTDVAANVPGATKRGRGTPFKKPRMVGMKILHTQSSFKIHNPRMPTNSSILIGNLGHHKPRSNLKWKGKTTITKHGLQEMRENKIMKTRSNAAKVNHLSQTNSPTFQ
ncbi:hypothetical protein KY284_035486 [Solanum tuberosum]|nr:hypothetical protein KY284_035486 [Solanum tuberosum]